MVLSNEPGYYESGKFGIRIENLFVVKEKDFGRSKGGKGAATSSKKFLRFERLTLIPIQKDLIDLSLMSPVELDWIDNYHAEVLSKIGPRLEDGSDAKQWLVEACSKIERS